MEANLPTVQSRSFGITPRGIDEAIRLAKIMAASGLMPKSIETPEAVFVAMQMGAEIGLSPMASVQNIAVINGTAWYLRRCGPGDCPVFRTA